MLRLDAALGPFLEMAISSVLSITLAEKDGVTVADVSYRVSGDAAHELDTTIGAERFLHPIHEPA